MLIFAIPEANREDPIGWHTATPTGHYAKHLLVDRTLQHICKAYKTPTQSNLTKELQFCQPTGHSLTFDKTHSRLPHGKHSLFRQFLLSLPPMKIFVFIMSFFLLYLSCLPCSDSKECNIKAEQKVSATTNHQQHKHTSEACTPFCTCSCCAASAFHQPFAKQQALKQIFQSVKYHIQNDSFLSQEFSSIWQPPKIS